MPHEKYIELAEKINQCFPYMQKRAIKTFFGNSGAEAVENAIKLARFHTGRNAVICFDRAFHGRTILGLSLTSKVNPLKKGFGPFVPEVYRAPYAYCYRCAFAQSSSETCSMECVQALENMFVHTVSPDSVAAIIMEPVLGEGGFVVPPERFLQDVAALCKKYGILFIADEVQTGFGRTGKLFAIEHMGVDPDLIVLAKSLANGFPLSAVAGTAAIMDGPEPGGLGGTYAGNPVSCAAALATLEVIRTEKLAERARKLGQSICERFTDFQERFEIIGDVRGIGAMMAMELVEDRKTKVPAGKAAGQLTSFCLENGLLMLTTGAYGNVVRLLPPLLISDEDLSSGLDIIEKGLTTLFAK